MLPTLPDNTEVGVDDIRLGEILAASFFSKFKDDLNRFQEENITIFGLGEDSRAYQFSFMIHLMRFVMVGMINGMALDAAAKGEATTQENVKNVFNAVFTRASQHLNMIYPDLQFISYAVERDEDNGKSKNKTKGP